MYATKRAPKSYDIPDASKYKGATEEIYNYLLSRKISKATVDAFRIKSDEHGNIVFPFYDNDLLVYVKYRKPQIFVKSEGSKEWQEHNTKAILFGLDMTSTESELIITEGEIDCMALYEAGIRNVTSVPCGANNEEWIDLCYDQLMRYPSILLFGDGDAPGRKAVENWSNRLGRARCRVVENYPMRPSGDRICKDANEILFFYGAEMLKNMCRDAKPMQMSGLIDFSTISTSSPENEKMIPSSFYTINHDIGGYAPGDLVVWTGRTGDGKSTVVMQEIIMAINSGEKVAWYTAELRPRKLKRSFLLQAAGGEYIGLRYDPRRDKELPYVAPDVESRINQWISDKIFLMEDNVASMHFDTQYIIDLIDYSRRRNGCTVAVVDNIMTAVMGASDESYLRDQERFTLSMKHLATSLDMVIHLVAHPRKSKDKLVSDDVSGSASITRLADTVLSVQPGEIRVLKDRSEGNTGGRVIFAYHPDSKQCVDVVSGELPSFNWDKTGIVAPLIRASAKYPVVIPDCGEYAV